MSGSLVREGISNQLYKKKELLRGVWLIMQLRRQKKGGGGLSTLEFLKLGG